MSNDNPAVNDELRDEQATPLNSNPPPAPPDTPPVSKEKAVSPAQPTADKQEAEDAPAQTVSLNQYDAIILDGQKSKSDRLREVIRQVHAQNPSFWNGEPYYEFRAELAKKLDVSKALVDKIRKEVLQVSAEEGKKGSDSPVSVPPAPKGAAETTETGAEAGQEIAENPQPAAPIAPAPEPAERMQWDEKKTGKIMKTVVNVPSYFLEEWARCTKEEEADLGSDFQDLFNELFPTTKKAGYLVYATAALENLLGKRVKAVIDHRVKKKPLDKVLAENYAKPTGAAAA